jgi:PIN domain nuclease of toxin-antitoxin system
MTYIIDTHALIWYIAGEDKLGQEAIEKIKNTMNTVYVSKASLWEMAVKISLGKLKLSISFEELEQYLEENEFVILDYDFGHLKKLLTLPFHHGDPFDRLIIAQAMADDLTIITHDRLFSSYPVKLIK